MWGREGPRYIVRSNGDKGRINHHFWDLQFDVIRQLDKKLIVELVKSLATRTLTRSS